MHLEGGAPLIRGTANRIIVLGQEKKMSWFWSWGGSILTLIKKKWGGRKI